MLIGVLIGLQSEGRLKTGGCDRHPDDSDIRRRDPQRELRFIVNPPANPPANFLNWMGLAAHQR
ncbi:MAG: hypothetical protein ABSG72_11525 [Candidatus Sulfotelmatobacter sp.]